MKPLRPTSQVLVYDCETNGLLSTVSKLHCLVVQNVDGSDPKVFHDDPACKPRHGSLREGVDFLEGASDAVYAGHNILEYDAPVLHKLGLIKKDSPLLDPLRTLDTLVASRLVYSDRKERDFALNKKEKLPGRYIGQHSLAAWGHRIGEFKGDYDGGWEELSQDMLDYCIQDVNVNAKLLREVIIPRLPKFKSGGLTTVQVEHLFAKQLFEQQRRGVRLDKTAGIKLLEHLSIRRAELEEEIRKEFPDQVKPYKPYPNGKPRLLYCKIRNGKFDHKIIPFNPGSRQQLAARLIKKYGWVPRELTATHKPAMHEQVLLDLCDIYPEVKLILEWLICNSRITILADGPQSYFGLVDSEGLLHGRTTHIGTVTHRCAHSKPNLGNVTSVRKPYGLELRSIFIPFPGYEQAGWDADGLELRMLAHYLGRYDDGFYANAVLHGDKSKGTDPHSLHAGAISTVTPCDRDKGKTFTYAYLYGAGDEKLGKIAGGDRRLGKRVRASLGENIPGLSQLVKDIGIRAAQPGHSLSSLDKRRVGIRHEHAALNSLLQTAGAVVMRWVPVLFYEELEKVGIIPGEDFLQTGHIHDEVQGSLKLGLREPFQEALSCAFSRATEALKLRCPVTGSADFGSSWADTH